MISCNEHDEFKNQSRSFSVKIFLQKQLKLIECNKEVGTLKCYRLTWGKEKIERWCEGKTVQELNKLIFYITILLCIFFVSLNLPQKNSVPLWQNMELSEIHWIKYILQLV